MFTFLCEQYIFTFFFLRDSSYEKIKISLVSLLFASFFSMASMTVVKNDAANNVDIDVAKILYVGGVDEAKVIELISAIDEINIKYKNASKIFLYINSSGGDMDSGYMAYEAVRNSTIPIVTVNASMTGSSATMIYCGAKERLMMSGAYFLLHPAATANKGFDYLKPDVINNLHEEVVAYNKMFFDIYKECTEFSKTEIEQFLNNEGARKRMDYNSSLLVKLSSGVSNGFMPAPVVYYISDQKSNN
ncbi:hypothetical protein B4916_21935 [Yersinia intermedia]|nr:hypothetical protein B4916_21935 [Yersinia intermedia]